MIIYFFSRQYGDHLYNKGDNATAIDNYIKTIGHLEPSYVIKRFLDAHKINFLTAYLQALHKQGLANEDHTTLLLNCYTKLKDQNKLDEFIFKGTLCQFLEFENTIVGNFWATLGFHPDLNLVTCQL